MFLDLLVAAMTDAATTGHLTQIQTTITPIGSNMPKLVRIVVVPEEMMVVRPVGGKFQVPT